MKLLHIASCALVAAAPVATHAHADDMRFCRALAAVEDYRGRMGDGKRALGPLQIHKPYWECAAKHVPSLRPAGYWECRDFGYSCGVVLAYLEHYAPEAWAKRDWFKLAQVHNSGPRGAARGRAKGYARRVVVAMDETK